MFVKNIIMCREHPMAIESYSYKVEFALRGAGHIHGVLWVDWERFTELPKADIDNIKEALRKIKNDVRIDHKEKRSIEKFADLFISVSLKEPSTTDIVEVVNIHGHTKTCRKYQTVCRFGFPKFPSLRTIVSVPYKMLTDSPEINEERLKHVRICV